MDSWKRQPTDIFKTRQGAEHPPDRESNTHEPTLPKQPLYASMAKPAPKRTVRLFEHQTPRNVEQPTVVDAGGTIRFTITTGQASIKVWGNRIE
jgi:hypothetical protein